MSPPLQESIDSLHDACLEEALFHANCLPRQLEMYRTLHAKEPTLQDYRKISAVLELLVQMSTFMHQLNTPKR